MQDLVIIPTVKQRIIAILKFAVPFTVAAMLFVVMRFYTTRVAILPVCAQLPWMRLVGLIGAMVLLALVYTFYLSGSRIWRSGQLPAPGTSVLFKTRVITGWWAKLNAVALFSFGSLAVIAFAMLLKFLVFSEAGKFIVGITRCVP